jgi:hypothetical protein
VQDLVEEAEERPEYTRKAIMQRARWLAVRLTSLADGLA